MTNQEKRLGQLETKLKSENTAVVLSTVTSLRSQEPCPGAIRLLAGLFDSSKNTIVRNHIRDFMNDMKQLTLRGEVVDEIKKNYQPDTIRMLVSSCWQSGLDYSAYASDFALIFSMCDFETAIECFTILEECASRIPEKTRGHIIIILRENGEFRSAEKTALTNELVAILS